MAMVKQTHGIHWKIHMTIEDLHALNDPTKIYYSIPGMTYPQMIPNIESKPVLGFPSGAAASLTAHW